MMNLKTDNFPHTGVRNTCARASKLRTFHTLLIATDANAMPHAACYVQAPYAWVPKFQATPPTRVLGFSGSKEGRMAFWVFQALEGAIRALTAKITVDCI